MNTYYGIGMVCIVGLLMYQEILTLKKANVNIEKRLNHLAELICHEELSSDWVSEELKEQVLQLKRDGKKVAAIKKIRENTQMDLIEAKQFVDKLD